MNSLEVNMIETLPIPHMTVREASKYLSVHEKTLYGWYRDGKIDMTLDVCGQMRVPYGEVWRLLREREVSVR